MPVENQKKAVVVTGNVVSGFRFVGPFDNAGVAVRFIESLEAVTGQPLSDYNVGELIKPSEFDIEGCDSP